MRRVGQTTSDDAATAAGDAAYARAKQSAWPPTEEDFRATGAAAGAAVGTIFGGAVGAAVGSVVGAAVGSFVYGAGDAIANGLDPNIGAGDAPLFMQHVTHTVAAEGLRAAQFMRLRCRTPSVKYEVLALQRWGAPISDTGYMRPEVLQSIRATMGAGGPAGVARALPLVTEFQKTILASTAARIAECETVKQVEGTSKNSPTAVIVLGVVSILGVGILQKFITRGKF